MKKPKKDKTSYNICSLKIIPRKQQKQRAKSYLSNWCHLSSNVNDIQPWTKDQQNGQVKKRAVMQ